MEPNQKQPLISNILPVTVTNNELLAVIFLFEFEEPTSMFLFNRVTLEEKPITTMYTDAKVNGHSIKLILNNQLSYQVDCATSVRIIITDEMTKTPIGKIDDFPFEVNNIIIPIKVLVIEATQYQALIENNWLYKTNTVLNWNIQELQLRQNGYHTYVPAICDYFKTTINDKPLIKLEEEKKKPI
ncbi:hypothetical protein G9A89_019504 [Geosiphon pyriformis]|nr:hypothetical protein G9A89_019504 [Geosiphon pyriformis]